MSSDGAYSDDPWAWFLDSFSRAQASEPFDASRAALATVDSESRPHVRFVLVKHARGGGFEFYTNLSSPKADHLQAHPQAALAFHWHTLGEQVRAEGRVERVSEAESDAYFASRPRGFQLSAWTSHQSQPIENRTALDARREELARRFVSQESITRPPFWGGFRLIPQRIEFWRNGNDRLHDRWCFVATEQGWQRTRLQP